MHNKTPAALDDAFRDRPELKQRLHDALDLAPGLYELISDVCGYVLDLKRASSGHADDGATLPIGKKRKIDDDAGGDSGSAQLESWASAKPYFATSDVSFSMPQRKKMRLELVREEGRKKGAGGARAMNSASGAVEFGIAWEDVEQVFCLPVPEKTTRQHSYVIIPKKGDGVTSAPADATAAQPVVWTVPETEPKTVSVGAEQNEKETYVTATTRALDAGISSFGKRVIAPSAAEFASGVEQSHRKGERAWHSKAFSGAKDGYLFFLSPGILWAFKKPLMFFSFETIISISYTSVLQRTFNLNIRVADDRDIEFSMLDQADFAGIDTYVRRHGLNDASMAEERRAKKLNINGVKNDKSEAQDLEDGAQGDETELAKAQRMIEDAEDEMEEDYAPGSEGESDGSGSGSDEEQEEGNDDGGDDDDDSGDDEDDGEGRDLIAEELGSEAEDVEEEKNTHTSR